ncbi:hypothetical protein TNCV_1555021 [Trichonephila clavipes]|nr:hypothetical protein TNCV_1555021 [Trichonephila clavipes]
MVTNDVKMFTKLAANLVAKKDANLTLLPGFRQVLFELRHCNDGKLLSWFCRWPVFYRVSCKLQNRSFSLDWGNVVEGHRIVRSSFELEPLQQSRPLGREQVRLQAT